MDPEQIYQEVLQEEQQKGSAPPVAEGRAKAARKRATEGSPHPKEPKWWPGSQPHLEAGGAPAPETNVPAAAPTPEPEPEAAAAEPAAEPAPPAPASEAPAPAPEPVAPAAATAQPAAAATAVEATPTGLVPEARPAGVTHGVPTGNRLRPEDAVATDGQLDAQKAHYERRKLIDELVATGVPEVAAADTARARNPALALMYILIPLAALGFLISNDSGKASDSEPEPKGGGSSAVTIVAEGIAFDVGSLTLPADQPAEVEFTNNDAGTPHNLAIYPSAEATDDPLFRGEQFPGAATKTYEIPPLEAGEYYFQCDVHPDMNGTVTAE